MDTTTETRDAGRTGFLTRIARWSIRHPWWAMGMWVAFVATATALGGMAGTQQASDSDFRVGESGRAEEIVEEAGLADDTDTENVLITSDAGWDEPAAQAAAADAAARLAVLPDVVGVGDPVPSPRADALLVPVTLAGGDEITPVLDTVAAVDGDHPELRVETVGDRSLGHAIDAKVGEDLGMAGTLSLPVTLAILLIVFGALLAAGVPLVLGFTAVAGATGLWAFASHAVPDIGTVPQLILLIGLAVGVDYSLFYLKRAREERARGHGTVDAVRLAAATSGRAVVVSAVTSIVALAGLYLAGDVVFASLGTGVILAVAVAMVGSLTVLPAVLAKLGRAVDRPRVPLLWRLTRGDGPPRVWPALLRPALRAPRTTLVVTLVVLVALAAPAAGMNLKNSSEEDLPRSIPVVRAYDRLVAAYPSEGSTHRVVVRAPAAQADQVRAALTGLSGEPVQTSADGTVAVLDIPVEAAVSSPAAEESLAELRTERLPAALAGVPGADHAVGGFTAGNVDWTDQQRERLPWVIGFVVLLTMLMMAFAFRSVVAALVAGALAVLSTAAAFGVVTAVFQGSWAEGLLDFRSNGYLVNWVPLFLFVVLFGLSMDYHVYVVSRIRDAAAAGLGIREAIRVGVNRSAGVVTSCAAVMVAIFAVFATMSFIEMKQMGVGLAVAIAIDATVVRLLLLPSVMALLGRANWWPSRLSRRGRAPAPAPLPATVPPPGVQTPVVARR